MGTYLHFFPTNHVLLKQFHTYYQSVYAKLFTSQKQQVKSADTTLIRKQDITCSNLTSTLQVTCYSRCGKKKKNVPRHSIQQHTHLLHYKTLTNKQTKKRVKKSPMICHTHSQKHLTWDSNLNNKVQHHTTLDKTLEVPGGAMVSALIFNAASPCLIGLW